MRFVRLVTVKDFSSGSGIKSSVKFNWMPINIVVLKNVTVAGILVGHIFCFVNVFVAIVEKAFRKVLENVWGVPLNANRAESMGSSIKCELICSELLSVAVERMDRFFSNELAGKTPFAVLT